MSNASIIDIRWPMAGIDRRRAFVQQPPFSTPAALNVRPDEAMQGRERGGSRPGLSRAFAEELGSGNPVRMLATVNTTQNDGFDFWLDSFDESSLSAAWSTPAWLASVPVVSSSYAVESAGVESGAVRSSLSDFDTTKAYELQLFVVPSQTAHAGRYRIFFRLDNATPNLTQEGVVASLTLSGDTGAYSGDLTVYVAGTPTTYNFSTGSGVAALEGWFTVRVSGNDVTCYWRGTQLVSQTISAPAGSRFGFGLTRTGASGQAKADRFRVQYYRVSPWDINRSRLIASSNGLLYRETWMGEMEQVSTSLTISPHRHIMAIDRGQKLYIADFGVSGAGVDGVRGTGNDRLDAASVSDWTALGISTASDQVVITNATEDLQNGTYKISAVASGEITLATAWATGTSGTATWRIERAPKIYDPLANTLSLWTATKGVVPSGCRAACLYRDRLVLANDPLAPQAWYMSRQGDPLDFDYSQPSTDVGRAVAGTGVNAGLVHEPVTAVIPYYDDFLLFGMRGSMQILRGDPAYGGQIDVVSQSVGIVDRFAWCFGPAGEVIYLSYDGIYRTNPECTSCVPVSSSRERLPRELQNINVELTEVSLAYDIRRRGVHIFLTPIDSKHGASHWWFDWETQSYWLESYDSVHEPTSMCVYRSPDSEDAAVLIGCRDGRVRRWRDDCRTDDGAAFSSYVVLGPIRPARSDFNDGIVAELNAELAGESGNVAWSIHVAKTAEAAIESAKLGVPFRGGTWVAGLNATNRPMARGGWFALRLAGGDPRLPWGVEKINAVVRSLGKLRV